MPRPLKVLIVLAIALHASGIRAAADPVRIVSGSLAFDTGGPPSFNLLTANGQVFEAEGLHLDWPATCFYQCSPGVEVPLSLGVTESSDDASMFFQVDGVDAFPVMNFAISAPSITLGSDAGTPRDGVVEFRRPFTFTGQLAGYASPDRTGPPLVAVTLTGSGMARLVMGLEEGLYTFSSLDYQFDPSPVPEPATLLLVGTGAAVMWRRRRASQPSIDAARKGSWRL
jgi:hypothetical protein